MPCRLSLRNSKKRCSVPFRPPSPPSAFVYTLLDGESGTTLAVISLQVVTDRSLSTHSRPVVDLCGLSVKLHLFYTGTVRVTYIFFPEGVSHQRDKANCRSTGSRTYMTQVELPKAPAQATDLRRIHDPVARRRAVLGNHEFGYGTTHQTPRNGGFTTHRTPTTDSTSVGISRTYFLGDCRDELLDVWKNEILHILKPTLSD